MRHYLIAGAALLLSTGLAMAQQPEPQGEPQPVQPATPEQDGDRAERDGQRSGPRHHAGRERGDGPRWRGMGHRMAGRQGPEFKVEIDEDGSVSVEVKCGARESVRDCADITLELIDRATN